MKNAVLITGSSAGTGKAMAYRFGAEGHDLILVARRDELLAEIKTDIESSHGVSVKTEAVDLSSQSAVQALYERVRGQSISTWINNAGLGDWNFAWDIPIEKMVSMLDLNVKALGLLSLMFVRDNLDKDATLINVASIAGYSLFPASIPYCATKFYVTALTEGLMHDVVANDHRVKVKLLVPGPIDTDFTRISLQETKLQMPDSSSVVFHSPEQMADFCYQLYGSDSSVGMVSLPDMTFHLRDPIHPIASL